MEELFQRLKAIIELLEQIKVLTDNQTTVLLSEETSLENESGILDLVEEMATYKDELMTGLREQEDAFQKVYSLYKEDLASSSQLEEIQKLVGYILQMQEAIVEIEQSNLLLMQKRSKIKLDKVVLPKDNAKVTAAYQKQQKKTSY